MKRMLVVVLLMGAMFAIGAGQAYASEGCNWLGDQILNEAKVSPWIAESIKAKCKEMAIQVREQCKTNCNSTYSGDILSKYGCTSGCGRYKDEMFNN